jgi:hypothetical protein
MAFQFNDNSSRKTFSETNNTLNFQTENMVQKIKTVHKKKKKHNYKNIEPLENIHDTNEDSFQEREPIIEGLAVFPVATFNEDDWTTQDDIYEGGNKSNAPTTKLSVDDIINTMYEYVNNLTTKTAEIIVKVLSVNKHKSSDIPIIKKYVCWSLSIGAASIAVFNWVFLMFYKEYDERIELYDISRESLHNAGIMNKFYALLDFLFDIPMFFPEKIQTVFVKDGPDFISNFVNITICFILLFVYLTKFFYTSASSTRKFLIDTVSFNMSNPILSFMYGATFLLYILSFFEFQPISAALNVAKLLAGFPASLLMPFISNIIKIFFLMMFAVPIAAIFCLLYIFIFSFFGIPLLSKYGFFETISKMYKYMDKHKLPVKKDTPCNPLSFFERILNSFAIIFDFVYKYAIQLSIIAMLIYGIIDYATNIKGPFLKLILLLLNCILIVALGIYSYVNYSATEHDDHVDKSKNDGPPTGPTLQDSIAEDASDLASWVASKTLPDLDDIKNKFPDLSGIANKLSNIENIGINFNSPNTAAVNPLTPSVQSPTNSTEKVSGIN